MEPNGQTKQPQQQQFAPAELQFNASKRQKMEDPGAQRPPSKRVNALSTEEKHCDIEAKECYNQRSPSPAESLQRLSRMGRHHSDIPNTASPNFRRENSNRSLKTAFLAENFGKTSSESGSHVSKPYSDAASVRSWASVGMGSTDGKKMIVRRVPTSPVELFNIVNPPT